MSGYNWNSLSFRRWASILAGSLLAVFASILYLLRSAQGFAAFQFGLAGDAPTPADYDGDGRADAAVFRNGIWWMLKSQSGSAEAVQFGLSSDTPVLSAFVR